MEPQDPDDESDEEAEEEEKDDTPPPRRSTRIAGGVLKPGRYAMASTKVTTKQKEKSEERKQGIEEAEQDEIKQIFIDLKALEPVYKHELNGVKPYNCHLFSVEKFLTDGQHDKFKSWIVMNGDEQDADLFPDRSSPTVAIHSIMTCLALVAYNGQNKLGKIDVKGAFIQTEMEGPPVFIRCNKQLMTLMVKTIPELATKVFFTAGY